MENFYERIERLGGMIKTARINLLNPPTEMKMPLAKLQNGSSMNKFKPVNVGNPALKGKAKPKFTSKMLESSPYNLR